MRTIVIAVSLLSLLLFPKPIDGLHQNPRPKGALHGVVLNRITNTPVAGVRVAAYRDDREEGERHVAATVTDGEGVFRLDNLHHREYSLRFVREGFVEGRYGERFTDNISWHAIVAPDKPSSDILIRLMPTASLSGSVRDIGAQPITGVPVELLRYRYDSDGSKKLQVVAKESTDDRGEFTFEDIAPGLYYVGAGGLDRRRDVNVNEVTAPYAFEYYPGVREPAAATPIQLSPGEEREGINFIMSRRRFAQVQGFVLDLATGRPPASVSFILDPPVLNGSTTSPKSYNSQNGEFTIGGLTSGEYRITVSSDRYQPCEGHSLLQDSGFGIYPRSLPRTSIPLRIGVGDLQGIRLDIPRTGCLKGTLLAEGTRILSHGKLGLQLMDGSSIVWSRIVDSRLQWSGLVPGEHRFVIAPMDGYYVKAARLGTVDALSNNLHLEEVNAESLEILLSPHVAQLSGVVTDSRGRATPGARVVLIPEEKRRRTDPSLWDVTDEQGQFHFSSVAPGRYKVFAWEEVEPHSWMDPQILFKYESKGKAVVLDEDAKAVLTLQVIPDGGE